MCGIFGFTQLTQNNSLMFPVLAVEMESRGQTSWGASNGDKFIKAMGAISKTFDRDILRWDTNNGLILHTRMPSSGTGRSAAEAHPFVFSRILEAPTDTQPYAKIKQVIGIHNGCIGSHEKLKNQYPERSNFDVDSMHIFKNICDDLPTTELVGSGAIAWYETEGWQLPDETTTELPIPSNTTTRLFLARFNTEAMHIAKLPDKSIVFASTKTAIERAATLAGIHDIIYETIKAETKYEVMLTDDPNIVEIGEMKFGSYSFASSEGVVNGRYQAPNFFPGQFGGGLQRKNESASSGTRRCWETVSPTGIKLELSSDFDRCPACLTTTIDPLVEIVCPGCFDLWKQHALPKETPSTTLLLDRGTYVN